MNYEYGVSLYMLWVLTIGLLLIVLVPVSMIKEKVIPVMLAVLAIHVANAVIAIIGLWVFLFAEVFD